MSSAGGSGSSGGEEMISFGTELDVGGITIGVDAIAQALEKLNEITQGASDAISGGFQTIEDKLSGLGQIATDATTTLVEGLDKVASGTTATADGITKLTKTLGDLSIISADSNEWLVRISQQLSLWGEASSIASDSVSKLAEKLLPLPPSLMALSQGAQQAATTNYLFGEASQIVDQSLGKFLDTINTSPAAFERFTQAQNQAAQDGIDQFAHMLAISADDLGVLLRAIGDDAGAMAVFQTAINGDGTALSLFADELGISEQTIERLGAAIQGNAALMDQFNTLVGVASRTWGDYSTAATQAASATQRASSAQQQNTTTTEQNRTALSVLSDALARAGAAISGFIARLTAGTDAEQKFGIEAYNSDRRLAGFGGGVGSFIATMLGFSIVTRGAQALSNFGNEAIQGNIAVEKFRQQLEVLTGSSGAAAALVAWSFKFGQTIPFTTTSLQQATLTIESLGQNAEQLMPALASVAAAMGTDLPTAAQAFLDAFSQHRFLMMQRDLRISESDLEKFGLTAGKAGAGIQATLAPAMERLAAARFPNALNTAMQTFSGETSNLTDQFQQLAIAFGAPIFHAFESILFQLTIYLQQNHAQLVALATAIGGALAPIISTTVTLLTNFATVAQHNQLILGALGGIIGGFLLGGIIALISGLAGLMGGVVGLMVPFLAIGAALGAFGVAIARAAQQSAPLRASLQALATAGDQLLHAVGGALSGALQTLGNMAEGASNGLGALFGSTHAVTVPVVALQTSVSRVNGHLQHFHQWVETTRSSLDTTRGPLSGVVDLFTNLGQTVSNVASFFTPVPSHVEKIHGEFTKLVPITQMVNGHLVTMHMRVRDTGTVLQTVPGHASGAQQAITRIGQAINAVAPFFEFLARLVGTVAQTVGGGLALAGALFAGAWAAIRPVLGPILAQLRDLGGTIRDQFLSVLHQLSETLHTQIQPALTALQPVLEVVGAIVGTVLISAFSLLIAVLKGAFSALGSVLTGLIQFVGGLVGIVAGGFKVMSSVIGGLLAVLGDIIHGNFAKIIPDILNAFHGLTAGIGQIFSGLGSAVMGIWKMTGGAILAFLGGFISSILGLFHSLADQLVGHSIIPDMLNAIVQHFIAMPARVLGAIIGFSAQLVGHFLQLEVRVVAAVLALVTRVLAFFQELPGKAINFIMQLVTQGPARLLELAVRGVLALAQLETQGLQKLASLVTQGLAKVAQLVTEGPTKLLELAVRGAQALGQLETQALSKLASLVTQGLAKLGDLVTQGASKATQFATAFLGALAALPGELEQAGVKMVQSLINGLTSKLGDLKNAVGNLASAVADHFPHSPAKTGPLTTADQWGPKLMGMLVEGIDAHAGDVETSAGNVAQRLATKLGQLPATQLALAVGQSVQAPGQGALGRTAPGLVNALAGAGAAPSGLPGGPAALGPQAAGSGGGTTTITVNSTMQANGGLSAGFQMLSSSDRAQFARDVGLEMARELNLQFMGKSGYTGPLQ